MTNDLTRGRKPFIWAIDVIQPKGNTEMRWVDEQRMMELLSLLSDELGNECDAEIKSIFPTWNYKNIKDSEE